MSRAANDDRLRSRVDMAQGERVTFWSQSYAQDVADLLAENVQLRTTVARLEAEVRLLRQSVLVLRHDLAEATAPTGNATIPLTSEAT